MADAEVAGDISERAGRGRLSAWFLLGGDRRLVAAVLSVAVFAGVVAVGLAVPEVTATLTSGDPIETLYGALAGATVTSVTLVVTLNQVVLSQELGGVSDQRDRMDGALAFRSAVADALDAPVAPADPAAFLRALVTVAGDRADALAGTVDDSRDDGLGAALVERTGRDADRTAAELEGEQFGRFSVVRAALDFNYSWKLHAAQRLRETRGDELPTDAAATLDDLIEVLTLFGPAREHVKTLYFQSDLIALSRRILVVAVPAIVVSVGTLLYLDPGTAVGAIGERGLVVLIAVTAAVSLAPFTVLLSYVLRIGTVTERTLSIGPFILRSREGDGPTGE